MFEPKQYQNPNDACACIRLSTLTELDENCRGGRWVHTKLAPTLVRKNGGHHSAPYIRRCELRADDRTQRIIASDADPHLHRGIAEHDHPIGRSIKEALTKVRQTMSRAMKLTAVLGAAIV